ncbi:hypothetical protein KAJ83_04435 [Marivibrio halodurans]|uniref:Uncharacterized protein n=1 Tax=Marivibrio halodurans TaxID=2039722 RepID=A0A8J7V1D7_9PROT|nr:hypothetical protein [Marivibrio halodurans]MBP5856245.1 hypothetical protein [Marivibrio halodurans]
MVISAKWYNESFCNFIFRHDYMSVLRETFGSKAKTLGAAAAVSAGVALASWGNTAQAGEAQAATPPVNQTAISECIDYVENTHQRELIYADTTPCEDLTIRDVASMNARETYLFAFGEASRRVYALGAPSGMDALNCLRNEFTVLPVVDGKKQVPRGLGGLIKLIHSANNNGGSDDPATGRIYNGVDWVAKNVCGLNPDQLASASRQPE